MASENNNEKQKVTTIQIRTGIVILTITTGIMALFAIYNYFETRSRITHDINALAEISIERLSRNLYIPLWELNNSLTNQIVKTEMLEKQIYGIRISSPDGKSILVEKKRDKNWGIVDTRQKLSNFFIKKKRIMMKGGQKIGVVEVYLTSKFMNKTLFHTLITTIITAFIINLVLLTAMALTLKNIIIAPIEKVINGLREIVNGEGDLTKRLSIMRNDEVGELAFWFNTFMDKLHEMIKNIADNSSKLEGSSNELSTLSQSMMSKAEQMRVASSSVSSSAADMSDNMSSVAAAMEQSSTNMNIVASSAEEMTSTISEIAMNSEHSRMISSDAVTQAKGASENIEKLGAAANEIGKVTETITEISEQTNLLALNATIEAARAGEAGKGFAVVANEIKELARQTADSTNDIEKKIEGIQTRTAGTVKVIEEILKVINDIDMIVSTTASAVEEQSATTKEIAENVAQASSGIQEVNKNISQSTLTSQEISNDISMVEEAANGMTESSIKANYSAEDLSKLASSLSNLVSQFKI